MTREQRIEAATLAIAYLESEPDFYQSVLIAARLSSPEHSISIVGRDVFEAETLAQQKRLIEQFMAACWFDPCPRCYQPCVWFMDGRALEWDSLGLHDCSGAALFSSPNSEQNATKSQRPSRPIAAPISRRPAEGRLI